MDAETVDRIKRDYRTANLAAAELALAAFAEKLTRSPAGMERGDVEELRRHGFSDRAILDASHVIGYFNHINRVADALGVDLEPEMPPDPRHPDGG